MDKRQQLFRELYESIIQTRLVDESVKGNRAIKSDIVKALKEVKKAIKKYYGKNESSGIGYLLDDTGDTVDKLLLEWQDADLTEK